MRHTLDNLTDSVTGNAVPLAGIIGMATQISLSLANGIVSLAVGIVTLAFVSSRLFLLIRNRRRVK